MMKCRTYILLGTISFLVACGSSKTILTRYHKARATAEKNGDTAVISVVPEILPVTDEAPDNSKTIFDLTPEGQKAYIKAIAEKTKDISAFNDAMNTKFLTADASDNISDITTRKLQIVFSVSQKDLYSSFPKTFSLGDRIEYLKISLVIDSSSILKFSNWNQFATQYGQYNIASRSFSGSSEMNANPSIPLTAGTFSLASLDKKSTLTENDSLKRRFALFSGVLQDDSLTIEQLGTPEINLTGNSSVDVTMSLRSLNVGKDIFQNVTFSNLKGDKGFSDPKDVTINTTQFLYPQLGDSIKARLVCTYAVRHIIKGDNTQTEGDDNIQYYHGTTTPREVTLINKEEAKPIQWGIRINGVPLVVRDITEPVKSQDNELLFSTYNDANNFLEWLLYTRPSIDNTLIIGKYQFIIIEKPGDNGTYFNKGLNIKSIQIRIP